MIFGKISKRGQVTILVLLLGLLALTVGLSAASRSLSDLKQATYVDSGTKALAAAEAALEYTLGQVGQGNITAGTDCTTFTNYPNPQSILPGFPIKTIKYNICGNSSDFAYGTVNADDVFETDLSTVNSANVKDISLVWKNPAAALEVDYLDSNFNVRRFAFNGSAVAGSNNFTGSNTVAAGSTCVRTSGTSLCADATYNSGSCVSNILSFSGGFTAGDKLIRVKPIYQSTDVAVCSGPAGGSPGRLTTQVTTVTIDVELNDGTRKRLQSVKSPAALPSALDNAIFSAGDLAQ